VQAADSYLLHSSLSGREREMKRLTRRLDRTLHGRGCAVVVEANPGVGRSRLLDEIALQGQLRGAIVVSVIAEGGRGPWALARGLLRGLLRNAPSDTRHAAAPYTPVLGHVLPELQAAHSELAVLPEDPAELRVRQQTALLAVVVELARERPLLILADDFHRSDDPSAALLAALAQYCPSLPMMLVASVKLGSVVSAPEALRAFRSASRSMRLHRLRRSDTVVLVESLFGFVPNVDRLANWIHDVTTGNPTQTMELARHLVESGAVQYAGGSWVLPLTVDQRAVPGSLGQALAMRLGTLSPEARALAGALCVREGAAPLTLVSAVAPGSRDDLFGHLEELVRKGVLESSGEGHGFVHEAMRGLLLDQLSAQEREGAHRTLGQALLVNAAEGSPTQLEGAWHLMRGGDDLRGARIVAAAMRVRKPISRNALPAVEEALRVLEQHRQDRGTILGLRTSLVIAAYEHERRLAYDYGFSTVTELFQHSGLGIARALGRVLGARAALPLALLLALLRRPFLGAKLRVGRALDYFARSQTNLLGALTIGVDIEAVHRVQPLADPLRGFPRDHACHIVYSMCRAMRLLMDGRENEHREACEDVVKRLSDPRVARQLSAGYRRDLQVGLLMSLGIGEGYCAVGRGLQVADRIETLGTYFGQVAAHRVRFIHHLMRGEIELAEPHRRRVELHAVQGGSTWQVEVWSLPLEALAANLSEDHIRLKHLAQSMGRVLDDVPSLRIFHELVESRVDLRRGDHEAGLARLERAVARMPPRQHVAWDVARLALADALLEMDRPGRAYEVCERALLEYQPGDTLHVIRIALEREAALAQARCERVPAARARLSALIEQVAPTGHPLLLCRLHEAGVELALSAADGPAVALHLSAMERAVEPTRNPALHSLYQSAAKTARGAGLHATADGEGDDDEDVLTQATNPLETKLAKQLDGLEPHEWPERLLRLLLARANVSGGYLYLWEDDELQLVAATLPDDPPVGLEQRIRAWIEELLDEAEGSAELTTLESTFDSDAPSVQPYRLILLPPARSGRAPSGVVAVLADDRQPSAPSPAFLRAVAAQLAQAS
jgi:hypothetical protein